MQSNLDRCGGFVDARYLAGWRTTENILVRSYIWNSGVGVASVLATVPTHRGPLPTIYFSSLTRVRPLRNELLVNLFDSTGELLKIPEGPGLGTKVDETALDQY